MTILSYQELHADRYYLRSKALIDQINVLASTVMYGWHTVATILFPQIVRLYHLGEHPESQCTVSVIS